MLYDYSYYDKEGYNDSSIKLFKQFKKEHILKDYNVDVEYDGTMVVTYYSYKMSVAKKERYTTYMEDDNVIIFFRAKERRDYPCNIHKTFKFSDFERMDFYKLFESMIIDYEKAYCEAVRKSKSLKYLEKTFNMHFEKCFSSIERIGCGSYDYSSTDYKFCDAKGVQIFATIWFTQDFKVDIRLFNHGNLEEEHFVGDVYEVCDWLKGMGAV